MEQMSRQCQVLNTVSGIQRVLSKHGPFLLLVTSCVQPALWEVFAVSLAWVPWFAFLSMNRGVAEWAPAGGVGVLSRSTLGTLKSQPRTSPFQNLSFLLGKMG